MLICFIHGTESNTGIQMGGEDKEARLHVTRVRSISVLGICMNANELRLLTVLVIALLSIYCQSIAL